MSGITHEWHGTVLSITTDSGTTSCDLKGDKGDDGVRGPQGLRGPQGPETVIDIGYVYTTDLPPTADEVGAVSKYLIWENATPDTIFPRQEVPMEIASFDAVEIVYRDKTGSNYSTLTQTFYINDDYKGGILYWHNGANLYPNNISRMINIYKQGRVDVNLGSIIFEDAYTTIDSNGGNINNEYIIPLKIYGVKVPQNDVADITRSKRRPLILYANKEYEYLNDSTIGDKALEAVLQGRQILVKIPNRNQQEFYVSNYSPIYMYQVPNNQNNYLYLFYLKDEKQDIDLTALGLGVIQMPLYGELKLLLSKTFHSDPMEVE